ncbi:MAG: glycoside hydrolase family 15 protein [Syntrophobacteraceae bacterium]
MMQAHHSALQRLLKPRYHGADLNRIADFFSRHDTLRVTVKPNGLYAAVSTEARDSVSGYACTWVRDTIMITHYQLERGRADIAGKTMSTLADYFYKHRTRFTAIIDGSADKNDPMQRPHIRFDGDTLEEIGQRWAHAQNDALGYALWMAFRLANLEARALTAVDRRVYALFPRYFEAVEYWQDADSGHWEEARKVESSSIGVVVAGIEEMKRYLERHPDESFDYGDGGPPPSVAFLEDLIARGRETLHAFLPHESPGRRKADAALLFVLYPLAILDDRQTREVLDLVLNDLLGDHGIKRYPGDSYWCADYKKLVGKRERTADVSDDMSWRDRLFKPGTEAQWCLFDPVVSAYFGRRYLETRSGEDLDRQIHHFNRSLSQITGEDCPFGAGRCPEAYYLEDSASGLYVPNDHVPLAWTQANVGVAFELMRRSVAADDA